MVNLRRGVREIFRKARQAAPCIVFLDEIDALVPRRGSHGSGSHVTENVVSQILTEIDGLEELYDVLVIGATNRLDIIDEALLRPGRFDRIIDVPAPDTEGRRHILEIHTRGKPLAGDVDIAGIVDLTDGFSGAETAAVANRASIAALRRYVASGSQDIKSIQITQQGSSRRRLQGGSREEGACCLLAILRRAFYTRTLEGSPTVSF